MIGEALLASLLSSCAPSVASETMRAIVMVESNANALSIGDNTAHRSYNPPSYRAAITLAYALAAQGHSLDLGIAQVNSIHLTRTVTIPDLFDPCRNLQVASDILAGAYWHARMVFPQPQRALRGALGAYNTGSIYGGAAYVARVVAAAGVQSAAILSERPQSPKATPAHYSLQIAHPKIASTAASIISHGTWAGP